MRFTRIRKHRSVELALPRVLSLIAPHRSLGPVVDDAPVVNTAPVLKVDWPEDVARPLVGVVKDAGATPYWTKYRRFLSENSFSCRFIDIHRDSWIDDVAGLDLLVWPVGSRPHEIEEARRKIFYLQDFLSLPVVPRVRAVNLYEDKVLQAWALAGVRADVPKTCISFCETDALERLSAFGGEVVWKITTGAGSAGVERLTSARAQRAVRKTFSIRGRRTYWPHVNQKGYVYLQSLERDLRVDLRVFVVGPILLGYYRHAPRWDFRASGMGLEATGALPPAAMEEASRIARALDVGTLSVDFICDAGLKRFKVIELSAFNRLESADDCKVDGVPGVYVRRGEQSFDFQPGAFWVPELALAREVALVCGLDGDQMVIDAVASQQGREQQPTRNRA